MNDHTEPVRVDWQLKFEEEKAKIERLVKRITIETNAIESIAEYVKTSSTKELRCRNATFLLGVARRLREEAKK